MYHKNRGNAMIRKDAIEEGLRLLVRMKRQEKIKRFRGKLKWADSLDKMLTDK